MRYYHADGDATDSVGSNDGTLNGDANATQSGIINESFGFDGNGDYVSIGYADIVSGNSMSFGAWMKPTDESGDEVVVGKNGLDTSGGGYTIQLNDGNIIYDVDHDLLEGTVCGSGWSGNKWTHVWVDYNGAQVTCYINAVEIANHSESANIGQHNSSLEIGRQDVSGFERPFNGLIDEVIILNRSLSANEIKEIYYRGLSEWGTATIDTGKTADNVLVSLQPVGNQYDSTQSIYYNTMTADVTSAGSAGPSPELGEFAMHINTSVNNSIWAVEYSTNETFSIPEYNTTMCGDITTAIDYDVNTTIHTPSFTSSGEKSGYAQNFKRTLGIQRYPVREYSGGLRNYFRIDENLTSGDVIEINLNLTNELTKLGISEDVNSSTMRVYRLTPFGGYYNDTALCYEQKAVIGE